MRQRIRSALCGASLVLALGAAPAQAATPVSAAPSVLPMILALVFVVALIPLAVWLIKRLGAGTAAGRGSLRVVETLALGPRERLVLIDDGHEFVLLGVTAQSINRLGAQPRRELPAIPTVAGLGAGAGAGLGAGFSELLRRARSRHEA